MKWKFTFIFEAELSCSTDIVFPSDGCKTPRELIDKISPFEFVTFSGVSVNLKTVKMIKFEENK